MGAHCLFKKDIKPEFQVLLLVSQDPVLVCKHNCKILLDKVPLNNVVLTYVFVIYILYVIAFTPSPQIVSSLKINNTCFVMNVFLNLDVFNHVVSR